MRALIRPTLFVIARLGLFLSVVAWGVGQWRHVVVGSPIGSVGVGQRGVFVSPYYSSSWLYQTREYPDTKPLHSSVDPADGFNSDVISIYDSLFDPPDPSAGAQGFSFAGVTFLHSSMLQEKWLSFRHWLIVTIFAIFNCLLMLLYRKRREVNPCEV